MLGGMTKSHPKTPARSRRRAALERRSEIQLLEAEAALNDLALRALEICRRAAAFAELARLDREMLEILRRGR